MFGRLDTGPAIAALVLVGVLARLGLASVIGLSIDESYGVVMARHLSAGYADHPPITWWLIAGAVRLFGSEAPFIVRLPAIVMSAGSTWLVYRIGRELFTARAGVYAAVALTFSPLFGFYIEALAITDGPVLFFVLAGVLGLSRAVLAPTDRGPLRWWAVTGFFFGCAISSKYSAITILPGLGIFLMTSRDRWRVLLGPGPYLAAVIALLVFSPVLIWNAEHDWVSFIFQGGRSLPGPTLYPMRVLQAAGMQALIIAPPIWAALLVALWSALCRGPFEERSWLLACLGAVPVGFFLAVKLWSPRTDNGFHWAAPGYAVMFPLLGALAEDLISKSPRAEQNVRYATWATASLIGVLVVAFTTHTMTGWGARLVPSLATRDPIVFDQVDWRDLLTNLRSRGFDPQRTFVVAHRWDECAKADYALAGEYPLLCLSSKPVHFALLNAAFDLIGRNAVVVSRKWSIEQARANLGPSFSALRQAKPITITQFGRRIFELETFEAEFYRGPGM